MSLPVDGVEGLIKGRLLPGAVWDLGPADDPRRDVIGYSALAASETIAPHSYGDWHGLFLMEGSATVGGRKLEPHDVLLIEPGAAVAEIVAGPQGAEFLEAARTAAGMDRTP